MGATFFFIELIGYWSPEYLSAKVEHWRQMKPIAPGTGVALPDDRLKISAADFPARFRGLIQTKGGSRAVLAISRRNE